jgi:hypothetical protein
VKLIRCALLFLPLALSVAAVCVSSVEQTGERGPWTGELTNTGDDPVHNVGVPAVVADADGDTSFIGLGGAVAASCPSMLLPRERGAFTLSVALDRFGPQPAFPLSARFDAVASTQPGAENWRSEGLFVRVLDLEATARAARVAIENHGTRSYSDIELCSVARDARGDATFVGYAPGPLLPAGGAPRLDPGASLEVEVGVEVHDDGTLQFFVHGNDGAASSLPADWQQIGQGFGVMAPPGWTFQPLQGIDSYVGEISGDGMRLQFDYGYYSNSLQYDDDPSYVVTWETIGGWPAKLVRPLPGVDGVTGVYFADLGNAPPFDMPTRFEISARGLTSAQQDVALEIFRTLRFHP